MKKFLKAVVALSICLSGWALLPLATLPTQAFGWELFAEAYGEIFSDGFETGDTSRWSQVVGEVFAFEAKSEDELEMTLRIDDANWKGGEAAVNLVTGVSDKGIPTFELEGRRRGGLFELRARSTSEPNVWVESPWREIADGYESIQIEWQRALEKTEDGLVYVSIDDEMLLWLVDLDNSYLPLREIHMTYLGGHPVATTLSGTFTPLGKARKQRK
jgi:hypothetical protein